MTDLQKLTEAAKKIKMTPAQKEAQRRSFVYGNLKLSNPNITRAFVVEVQRRVEHEAQEQDDE